MPGMYKPLSFKMLKIPFGLSMCSMPLMIMSKFISALDFTIGRGSCGRKTMDWVSPAFKYLRFPSWHTAPPRHSAGKFTESRIRRCCPPQPSPSSLVESPFSVVFRWPEEWSTSKTICDFFDLFIELVKNPITVFMLPIIQKFDSWGTHQTLPVQPVDGASWRGPSAAG